MVADAEVVSAWTFEDLSLEVYCVVDEVWRHIAPAVAVPDLSLIHI